MRNTDLNMRLVAFFWICLFIACKQQSTRSPSSNIKLGDDAAPNTENFEDPESACLQLSSFEPLPAIDPSTLGLSSVSIESSEVGGFKKAKVVMKPAAGPVPDIYLYKGCTIDGESCVNGTTITGVHYNPSLPSGQISLEAFACVFSRRAKVNDPSRRVDLRKGTTVYCSDSEKAYGSIDANSGQEQLGLYLGQQYQIDQEIEGLSYEVFNLITTQGGGASLNLTSDDDPVAVAKNAIRAAGPGLFAALVKKDLLDNLRGVDIAEDLDVPNGQQLRLTDNGSPCINDEFLDQAEEKDNETPVNGGSSQDDDGTDTGSTDTGSTDTGSADTGSTDPGSTDPGSTDPGSTDPGSTDPGSTDPGSTDPGSTDPGSTDPGSTDPGSTDPGSTDPGSTDPGSTDPGSTDPGSTDEENEQTNDGSDKQDDGSENDEEENSGEGGGGGTDKTKRNVLIAMYTIGATLTIGGQAAILWSTRDVEVAQHTDSKGPGFLAQSDSGGTRSIVAAEIGSDIATTNQKYAALVPSYTRPLALCALNLTAGDCKSPKTYYDELEVKPDASKAEITKAYRKLAVKHHPDKAGNDGTKFAALGEAYEVLNDDAQRNYYDRKVTTAKDRDKPRAHQDFLEFRKTNLVAFERDVDLYWRIKNKSNPVPVLVSREFLFEI